MYYEKRKLMYEQYHKARDYLISNSRVLIDLEHYTTDIVNHYIYANYEEFLHDYNEASYLNPFWANYPPDDRGRQPIGDQVPWIEVGEHAIGHKLDRIISTGFTVSEVGLPSGADNRFTLVSDEINQITQGLTNKIFLFIDIKSVGPRDNFDHTVISPYQVSGDGIWEEPNKNMVNSVMKAVGRIATHNFYPAIAPIYSFSDGSIAPTIHLFVKPVYRMMSMKSNCVSGQPLESITSVCVPNGLLLAVAPNYLAQYPRLFFPGKDDKNKDPRKIRVRVSFEILKKIASWRVNNFKI